ncbi:hypothetical protein Tco_1018253 [Tanacetum coccineum]|uniref:Uncharacterized protein n=1 Tax=Tanacetum coccineum TaxID=301880 RepID=A0ABQ5FVC2_9ASTR
MCDVPFRDNSSPLDISKDQFEGFSDSNDDSTSIDGDSFSMRTSIMFEPDPGELTRIVDSGIHEKVLSTTNVNLPFEDDQSPLLAYVVWIFLSFLTYPVAPPYLLSCGNEDTIFDPGISIYHSFMPGISHRSGTFMKFNDCPDFDASRARGFCPSITRASSPQLHLGNPLS